MAIVQHGESFVELVALMQRLLALDGCFWDCEQTLGSQLVGSRSWSMTRSSPRAIHQPTFSYATMPVA